MTAPVWTGGVVQVFGIDPGLADTGLVLMSFDMMMRRIVLQHRVFRVFDDTTPDAIAKVVKEESTGFGRKPHVFVEKYAPWPGMDTNVRMLAVEQELRRKLDATFVLNRGIKQIVTEQLLQLVGVWKFSTPTRHHDLRSAARIGLLGMLKDDTLNPVLSEVVRDAIWNQHWEIVDLGGEVV